MRELFEPGDEVWLLDGQRYLVVADLVERVVVTKAAIGQHAEVFSVDSNEVTRAV